MKEIRIKFIGFWPGFNEENNFLLDILKERYKVVVCENAAYAFVGPFDSDFSACSFPGVRIFFSGENLPPDFAIFDYGISFDRLTYGDRYMRYPIGLTNLEDQKAGYQPERYRGDLAQKNMFAVFLYSHKGDEYRKLLFDKLSQYKFVTSPGKYLHNTDIVVSDSRGRIVQMDFESKAKFVIACENTFFPGYVTEKLDLALRAKSIPIYYGDPTVCEEYNPKAFINCIDYPSIDAVIERVKEIDQNDELYMSIVNEPPYRDKDYLNKKRKALESFLFNIFDQEYSDSFRRPMQKEANFCLAKEKVLRQCNRILKSPIFHLWHRCKRVLIKLFIDRPL